MQAQLHAGAAPAAAPSHRLHSTCRGMSVVEFITFPDTWVHRSLHPAAISWPDLEVAILPGYMLITVTHGSC